MFLSQTPLLWFALDSPQILAVDWNWSLQQISNISTCFRFAVDWNLRRIAPMESTSTFITVVTSSQRPNIYYIYIMIYVWCVLDLTRTATSTTYTAWNIDKESHCSYVYKPIADAVLSISHVSEIFQHLYGHCILLLHYVIVTLFLLPVCPGTLEVLNTNKL